MLAFVFKVEAAYCDHGQCYLPVNIINFPQIICRNDIEPLKLWLMVSFSLVQSDHIK
jgi:hypothetical protein